MPIFAVSTGTLLLIILIVVAIVAVVSMGRRRW